MVSGDTVSHSGRLDILRNMTAGAIGPYFFPVEAGGDRLHARTEGVPVILPVLDM